MTDFDSESEPLVMPAGPLVAVMQTRMRRGLSAPGALRSRFKGDPARPYTFDWRAPPGSPENSWRVEPELYVRPLHQVLTHPFTTEAMVVPYVLYGPDDRPLPRQPRINKDGVPWLEEQGYKIWCWTLWIDIDNPRGPDGKKLPWTADMLAEAEDKLRDPSLASLHDYYSRHGMRLVQELSERVSPEHYEQLVFEIWDRLRKIGLIADDKCSDWTHLYRPPKFRAPGDPADRRDPEPRLDGWAIAPAPYLTPEQILAGETGGRTVRVPRARSTSRRSPPRPLRGAPLSEVPPAYAPLADALVAGIAAEGDQAGKLHDLFLTLAGALCHERFVPLEIIPAVVESVAHRVGVFDDKPRAGAVDTIAKYSSEVAVRGRKALRAGWPRLADALRAAVAEGRAAEILAAAQPPPAHRPTADEASAAILQELMYPSAGVTTIGTSPGTGKSAATRAAAAEHARLLGPTGRRAPDARTSISVPTHELAIEYYETMKATYPDVTVARLASQPSIKNPDGTYACKFRKQALALAAGGLSVKRELCDGRDKPGAQCPYRSGCAAYEGLVGDPNALVQIGVHPYLSKLSKAAGKQGALVIDEPPPPTVTFEFTVAELAAIIEQNLYDSRYDGAMRPAMHGLLEYARHARLDLEGEGDGTRVVDAVEIGGHDGDDRALRRAANVTDTSWAEVCDWDYDGRGDVVLQLAAKALLPDAKTRRPLRFVLLMRARAETAAACAHAAALGRACQIYGLVHDAIVANANPDPAKPYLTAAQLWIEERRGERWVVVKSVNAPYAEALNRDGPTFVLDAHVGLQRDAITRFIGAAPREITHAAADSAPVERTIHLLRGARAYWFDGGTPDWSRVDRALRVVAHWRAANPATRKIGLVTFVYVQAAIDAIRGVKGAVAAWNEKYEPAELERARTAIGEAVAALAPHLEETGHYGAIRGVNRFHEARLDGLVTMGDPYPNLGDAARDRAFLRLDGEDYERLEATAAAELGQAQERIRTCRLDRPVRVLHVGTVVPDIAQWRERGVLVVPETGGEAGLPAAMDPVEFRIHMQRLRVTPARMAELLEVSIDVVKNWTAGRTAITADMADTIRKM